jgi:hypothetical protein
MTQIMDGPQNSPLDKAALSKQDKTRSIPDKFTLFPKLPLELRDTIWKLALPRPQTVEIHEYRDRPFKLPVPVVLHVDQEARRLAKRHYTLSLEGLRKQGQVYIDFHVDTLLIKDVSSVAKLYDVEAHWNRPRPWKLRNAEAMKHLEDNVQHLAVGESSYLCPATIEVYCRFTKLMTLSVD